MTGSQDSLRLDLGDTEGANEILKTAQQELQKMTKRTFRQFWVQQNLDGTVRQSLTSGMNQYSAHIDPNFDPRAEREVLSRLTTIPDSMVTAGS